MLKAIGALMLVVMGFIAIVVIGARPDDDVAAGRTAQASSSRPVPPPALDRAQLAALAESRRIQYAKNADKIMLDNGIESTTAASGPHHTTLTIHCAAAGRVLANQMAENGVPDAAKSLGFRKLILTDDYDTQFTWDLTK